MKIVEEIKSQFPTWVPSEMELAVLAVVAANCSFDGPAMLTSRLTRAASDLQQLSVRLLVLLMQKKDFQR